MENWVDVKTLATALDVSTRTIQLKASKKEIESRKKDSKSLEIYIPSLPSNWLNKLGVNTRIIPSQHDSLSAAALSTLGRKLSEKERSKLEVYNYYKNFNAFRDSHKITATASFFGISEPTVRRHIKEVENKTFISPVRKSSQYRNWDEQAIEYLRSYYLSLLKERNINSKQAAWEALQREAAAKGWSFGSRTAAFEILSAIPEIYLQYATGGRRALDNLFYIKRDWDSIKPAQILIGDQHIADYWVIDSRSSEDNPKYFRPCFYVWEDASTRCIAGISVDKNYTSDTVKEALHMAVRRFGFFDCTYNDNGAPECSKAAVEVIDELILLSQGKTNMYDLAELYKMEDGSYAIENEEGEIIDSARDVDTWRSKHRRMYARVKNAKAKPIERLFSTLENGLAKRGIPGHVVTPNAPAHQNEKEQDVLDSQKAKGQILTIDEFVYQMLSVINEYENTPHKELKGQTPMARLKQHLDKGWLPHFPATETDLDFVFMSRKEVKIRKGRVTVNNIQFIGEDLRSEGMDLGDVGLWMHEGEKVEVRYNVLDMNRAFAIIPKAENKIRALRPTEEIVMLDNEALTIAMEWKRRNMKSITESFKLLANPQKKAVLPEAPTRSKLTAQINKANKDMDKEEVVATKEAVAALLEQKVEVKAKSKNRKVRPLFRSDHEKFKWCLDCLIEEYPLTKEDENFIKKYKLGEEYLENQEYWEIYEKFGGM